MGKCLQNLQWPQIKAGKVLSFVLLPKSCFQTPAGIEQAFGPACSFSQIIESAFQKPLSLLGKFGFQN